MATYTHNPVGGLSNWWGGVIPTPTFTNGTNTTSELVINNTDGTFTHLYGTFTIFLGAVTGGTINTLQRSNTSVQTGGDPNTAGGAVYERISGLSMLFDHFINPPTGPGNAIAGALGGDDVMTGWFGDDYIKGEAGSDSISGGEGADTLIGGNGLNQLGNDTLRGEGGNDELWGEDGTDTLDGGTGNDTMRGGTDHDVYVVDSQSDVVIEQFDEGIDEVRSVGNSYSLQFIENIEKLGYRGPQFSGFQGTGNGLGNTIDGWDGQDFLFGLSGNDTLWGLGNNDYLDGGIGIDSMIGGSGDDTFVVDMLDDVVVEAFNEGKDSILTSIANYALFQYAPNVENLEFTFVSAGVRVLGQGNDSGNRIVGHSGDGDFFGGLGKDTILGNDGNDVIDGGAANDTLEGGNGNDSLIGGADDDTLLGGAGLDTIVAGNGNDTVDAGADNDLVLVPLGVTSADGGTGVDTIDFRDGFLTFGDAYTFNMTTGWISVGPNDSGAKIGQAVNFERALMDYWTWTVIGSGLDNQITGNAWNDQLFGMNGNDLLVGNGGNDTIDGGAGEDSVDGGSGNDIVFYDSQDQAEFVYGGADTDTLVFIQQPAPTTFELDVQSFEKAEGRYSDGGNVHPWTSFVDYYDQAWRKTHQTGLMDDGKTYLEDYDEVGDQPWVRITYWNDALGRPDAETGLLDDGRTYDSDHDNGNQYGWTRIDYWRDALGRSDTEVGTLDDGRRYDSDHDNGDQFAWLRIDYWKDALGRDDYQNGYFDLDDATKPGWSWQVDYDQANEFAWTRVERFWNAANVLQSETFF